MSEFKPTPGGWGKVMLLDGFVHLVSEDWRNIAKVYQEDDAKLIADAGTTYNATGMTPSQLAERVKVLEDALKAIDNRLNDCEGGYIYSEEAYDSFHQSIAKQALAK